MHLSLRSSHLVTLTVPGRASCNRHARKHQPVSNLRTFRARIFHLFRIRADHQRFIPSDHRTRTRSVRGSDRFAVVRDSTKFERRHGVYQLWRSWSAYARTRLARWTSRPSRWRHRHRYMYPASVPRLLFYQECTVFHVHAHIGLELGCSQPPTATNQPASQ